MKNGIFKVLGFLTLSIMSTITFANENYTPNPFTPAPKAASVDNPPVVPNSLNQASQNEINFAKNLPNQVQQGVNNVTQVLTEREIRSQKILEAVNGKIANAKNIPIENSRFIGVLNGKRVYQNLDTNEYVKIEIEK